MTVGRGWRTPAKHAMMRSFVGQESGVGGTMPAILRHVWIDLTAGDAVTDHEWKANCSPGILAHYASQARKPVTIRLNEIQPSTFDRLIGSLEQNLPELGYQRLSDCVWQIPGRVVLYATNQSGHHVDVTETRRTDAVLILNDPNAITDWAMRPTLAAEIADRTPWSRSLSTMGCNAAGLKRLDTDTRNGWFDHVEDQQAALPRYRDLLLAAIDRDDAQWAYLISDPGKWRAKTERVVQTEVKTIERTATMSWFRTAPAEFEQMKQVLFLTKKERGER